MSDRESKRDPVPRLVWGHININVADLDRSIAFYEKLGFEVFMTAIPYLGLTAHGAARAMHEGSSRALGLPSGIRGRACIMQLGGGFPTIDLTELAGEAAARPPTNADLGPVRLCLASRDLLADHARLSDQGVPFLSEPQPAKDGLADIATCVDPDGTLIELLQVYLDRWPSPAS